MSGADRHGRSGDGGRRRSIGDDPLRRSIADGGRRRLLRAGLGIGFGMGFGLGASGARACDFTTINLHINHVWARATADAPFAIICMAFDQVTEDDRLIGAETPVAAGVEIGGSVEQPTGGVASRKIDVFIPAGRTTVLDEAGRHLRLTGLRKPLIFGASYPLTLVFERGDPVSADIDIDFGPLGAG